MEIPILMSIFFIAVCVLLIIFSYTEDLSAYIISVSILFVVYIFFVIFFSLNNRITEAERFLEQHEAVSIELISRAEKAPLGSFEQFQVFYEIMRHNELFNRNMRRYRRSDRFGHLEPINIIWSESD